MINQLCHIEFFSTDFDRSQKFFEGLFGWDFRDYGSMEMRVFGIGDQHIGGFIKKQDFVRGDSPSLWFQVDNLEAAVQRATNSGGSVVAEASPVPGVGLSAQVADPDGNLVGLVEYTS